MRRDFRLSRPLTVRIGKRYWHVSPYAIVLAFFSLFSFALVACVVLALFGVVGSIYATGNILPGVTVQGTGVNSVSIGNLSTAAAATQLSAVKIDRPITLRDGNRTWQLSSADLGFKIDGKATANAAAQVGRTGNGILDGLNSIVGQTQIAPIYTLDLAKTSAALQSLADKANVAVDTTTPGRTLNVDATLDAIPTNLESVLKGTELKLVMDVVQGPHTQYTVQRGEELGTIAKKFNVAVSDIVKMNNISDPDSIYPGQTLNIPAAGIYVPTEKDSPPAPLAKGKAIVVSLLNQRIYAYQDGHLVHSSLMSSGKVGDETVIGDFHVYVKYVTTRMTGPDYDIPDVPWTMYFYQGYGIHGAYWHDVFGRQASHGCVNLDTAEAKWFFDFAPVGTLVRVLPNFVSA